MTKRIFKGLVLILIRNQVDDLNCLLHLFLLSLLDATQVASAAALGSCLASSLSSLLHLLVLLLLLNPRELIHNDARDSLGPQLVSRIDSIMSQLEPLGMLQVIELIVLLESEHHDLLVEKEPRPPVE